MANNIRRYTAASAAYFSNALMYTYALHCRNIEWFYSRFIDNKWIIALMRLWAASLRELEIKAESFHYCSWRVCMFNSINDFIHWVHVLIRCGLCRDWVSVVYDMTLQVKQCRRNNAFNWIGYNGKIETIFRFNLKFTLCIGLWSYEFLVQMHGIKCFIITVLNVEFVWNVKPIL